MTGNKGARTSSGADVCVFNDRRLRPRYVLRQYLIVAGCGINSARCHLHRRRHTSSPGDRSGWLMGGDVMRAEMELP